MHRFCKVVTSEVLVVVLALQLYMHRFCKVVTSAEDDRYLWIRCTYIDFVRL